MSGTDSVSSSSKPPLLVDPAVKSGTIKCNSYNGDGTSIVLFVPDDDKAVTTRRMLMTRALSRPWQDRPEGALGANELLSCSWQSKHKVSLVQHNDTPTEIGSCPKAGRSISLTGSLSDDFH